MFSSISTFQFRTFLLLDSLLTIAHGIDDLMLQNLNVIFPSAYKGTVTSSFTWITPWEYGDKLITHISQVSKKHNYISVMYRQSRHVI